MPGKPRRQPTEIAVAWREATSHFPLTAEGGAEWQRLWDAHTNADGWVDISIRDANLLATLGWSFAAQDRDWEAARERAIHCTRHPDWESLDGISRQFVLSRIAVGQLLIGEREVAISGYRSLLAMRRPYHPVPTYLVRNDLLWLCGEQISDEIAPEDLAGLVRDVVAQMPGCKRVARGLDPGNVTYGGLNAALEATCPRRR